MPDHRLWAEAPDPYALGRVQTDLVNQMRREHPAVTFVRLTLVDGDYLGIWICMDGWQVQPVDQGPEPTAAEIPVGFV